MNSVLLVEDSSDAFQLVKRALGTRVHLEWVKSLSEVSVILRKKAFDLILLDVTLPDGDGYRLCSILQTDDQLKNIPVVFLTARNTVSDRVLGFSVGADDYISKPFDGLELRARIDSRLRKRDREKFESGLVRLGDIEINKSTQKVLIFEQEQASELDLTPIEFKILLFLSKEPNKVFSRDDILDAVWGKNVHVFSRSVDTHVSKLRKKLGAKAAYIESVHGSGYRLAHEEVAKSLQVQVAPHPFL